MTRTLLTTFLLLCFGFARAINPADSIPKSPPFLLKAGGYLLGESVFRNASSASLNAGLEIPFGKKFSLASQADLFNGQSVQELDGKIETDIRYYPEGLWKKGQPVSYNGWYVGLNVYVTGKKLPAEGFYPLGSEELNTPGLKNGLVLNPYGGVGAKIGIQTSGFLDFGVFAGVENAGEVQNALGQEQAYYNRKYYPEIHSYFTFNLPIAPKGRNFYRNLKLFSSSPYPKKQLLKLGLQDVFSFSAKGIFFNPRIAYERALGDYFAINTRAKLYFERRYQYGDFISDPTPIWVRVPFFTQTAELQASVQPRFYIPGISAKRLKDLSGFYVFGEAASLSRSSEQKKQYWEYQKESSFALGYGLGFQERLYNHILIDLFAGMRKGLKNKNRQSLMGGVEVSWAL